MVGALEATSSREAAFVATALESNSGPGFGACEVMTHTPKSEHSLEQQSPDCLQNSPSLKQDASIFRLLEDCKFDVLMKIGS
jgi:hypothetical protein